MGSRSVGGEGRIPEPGGRRARRRDDLAQQPRRLPAPSARISRLGIPPRAAEKRRPEHPPAATRTGLGRDQRGYSGAAGSGSDRKPAGTPVCGELRRTLSSTPAGDGCAVRAAPYPTQRERRAEGTRAGLGGPPVVGEGSSPAAPSSMSAQRRALTSRPRISTMKRTTRDHDVRGCGRARGRREVGLDATAAGQRTRTAAPDDRASPTSDRQRSAGWPARTGPVVPRRDWARRRGGPGSAAASAWLDGRPLVAYLAELYHAGRASATAATTVAAAPLPGSKNAPPRCSLATGGPTATARSRPRGVRPRRPRRAGPGSILVPASGSRSTPTASGRTCRHAAGAQHLGPTTGENGREHR